MEETKAKNYWFKRRRYGYGWFPTTWQGWAVIGVYLVGMIAIATAAEENPSVVILFLILLTAGLLTVTYQKGPKPKWRWGKTEHDNPEEDF